MTFPCKVYCPRANGPDKVLIAKDNDELDGLLRVGWKLEESAPNE